jgi:exoribonuclease-2
MHDLIPYRDSLVLFRGRPARVRRVSKTLEIELAGGELMNVRAKDVIVLHHGPLRDLADLAPPPGDAITAWELLAGRRTTLADLAELAFGVYSPATAWAAWQLVVEGLYFRGSPQEVWARNAEEVALEQLKREQHAAEERSWAAFLGRAHTGRLLDEDRPYLQEVEDVALGRRERSRALRELKRPQTPESAHAALLELGAWSEQVNPYPLRLGVTTKATELGSPPLREEPRRDLTHLAAFAVDDEGNQEPDDALSLDGSRLWVHIADVAAVAPPDSPLDLEARARGATLYLPEGPVPMLPWQAVQSLGLGLADVSPALSIGLDLESSGEVQGIEVAPSWVQVTRLTYEQLEPRLHEEPFRSLHAWAQAHRERRRRGGAVLFELPEVKLWVTEGEVSIRPLAPLQSRDLVAEAMLAAGAAVARFAVDQSIPLPFTTQDAPPSDERPHDMAGMYALRSTLRPSQHSGIAGPHAGLGLTEYVQATSPLRRYLDLVVHQQLRAYVRGEPLLGAQAILERIGAAIAASGSARQAERLSRRHWTLVYLLQHPDWQGKGIVVDRRDRRTVVLIAELELDCPIHARGDLALNSPVRLARPEVNLAHLDVHFQVVGQE